MIYTFLGGFLAVCWTDFLQGILMFIAITVVPLLAYNSIGGLGAIETAMSAEEISLSLLPAELSIWAVISSLAWGLGYFGQPHILARFMGIDSAEDVPRAMKIAVVWVFISLTAAVAVGIVSIPIFDGLAGGDQEKVFIYLIERLFNPWVGGILLAAILSAIMSTIDSQLLVSSSTLTEDFYKQVINQQASEQKQVWISRLSVIFISLIALFLALSETSTVLGLVAYAWAGFGAAFGPAVLFALFSKHTSWQSVLSGMVVGTLVLIIWKQLGWDATLYEIIPGFIANVITIAVVDQFVVETSSQVVDQFEEVTASLDS